MKEKEAKMKEKEDELKEKEAKREREIKEFEAKEREAEREFQLQVLQKKIELGAADDLESTRFDVSKCSRLVPNFDEDDVDSFFLHFEKIACNMKWPKEYWPALVQSSLTGKGRSTYLSLSLDQSSDYDIIKKAVSQEYNLTADNYS